MEKLRYPAVPLITVDPFFSVWSCADTLYEETTRFWTGKRQSLIGLLNIDGAAYRFMGKVFADGSYNMEARVIEQTDVTVYPMRTAYTFENEIVRLKLTFMTPLLTDDFYLMTRPVSYISYEIEVLDGKTHEMQLLFGADASISVDNYAEAVTAELYEGGVRVGKGDKDVLSVSGDCCAIDWGWLHLYSADGFAPAVRTAKEVAWHYSDIISTHCIPAQEPDFTKPFALNEQVVYITLDKEFTVSSKECGFICAAYDDIHSLKYLDKVVDAYYKKDGDTFEDVRLKALSEYDEICARVEKAEADLLKKAEKFGKKYADIISLAYRQVIAAHKLTWDGEEVQFMSKECFSNGCIATLDVTYPSIPMFLLLEPTLVEGMLNPLFKYANTEDWPYDFAPHDVGQYPLAVAQRYGRGTRYGTIGEPFLLERQMPVEESGNAILCVYTVCHYKKDMSYFIKHKALMDKWVEYLVKYGLDPENQLCTDDFAGHLAHNCNLSLKAIMGIAAYAKMMESIGDAATAEKYLAIAKEYATNWEKTAFDGDHYRLAFDREGSWSIKYNMVWDKIFGWGIFLNEVFEREIAYYKKVMHPYGLPLDSRSDYTKSDWQMWSVRLADEDTDYMTRIVDAMWAFLNESYPRVPFTDWYFTSEPKERGSQNRTVQGGLFIPLI